MDLLRINKTSARAEEWIFQRGTSSFRHCPKKTDGGVFLHFFGGKARTEKSNRRNK